MLQWPAGTRACRVSAKPKALGPVRPTARLVALMRLTVSTPLWSALILLRDTVRVRRRASCALASGATLNGTYSTSSFTLPTTCRRASYKHMPARLLLTCP